MNPAGAREDFLSVCFEDHDHGAAANFAVVVDFGGHFGDPGKRDTEGLKTGGADDFVDIHVGFGSGMLESP